MERVAPLTIQFQHRRGLAVRACTHGRFAELWGQDEYYPGVIDEVTKFSIPHGAKEVSWYESDNCYGCVVYSEPEARHFPKSPDYASIVFSKGQRFDVEYAEPLDMEEGFEDIAIAEDFLMERLTKFEQEEDSTGGMIYFLNENSKKNT